MTRIASTIDIKTRREIYESFLIIGNKTSVAADYNISPRTVGRIVDEFSEDTPADVCGVDLDSSSESCDIGNSEEVDDLTWQEPTTYQYFVVGTPQLMNITRVDLTGAEPSKSQIVHESSEKYEKTVEMVRKGLLRDAYYYNDEVEKILTISHGKLTLDPAAETLRYEDPETGHSYDFDSGLTERALSLASAGESPIGLMRFAERLIENPNPDIVRDLYKFLEASDVEITEEGMVHCYKKITHDFKDVYTKRIDNSIGATPKMPRALVDHNRNNTCSEGLHVCSKAYLGSYGGDRIVLVEVDPKDFVAIPMDYYSRDGNSVRAKARVSQYKVLKECTDIDLWGNDIDEE